MVAQDMQGLLVRWHDLNLRAVAAEDRVPALHVEEMGPDCAERILAVQAEIDSRRIISVDAYFIFVSRSQEIVIE